MFEITITNYRIHSIIAYLKEMTKTEIVQQILDSKIG